MRSPNASAGGAFGARPATATDTGGLLAVCHSGGVNINAWMVARGWALAYRRYSVEYVDEERAARAARRGIWRGQFVAPWEWRRGKRVAGARKGSFHRREHRVSN